MAARRVLLRIKKLRRFLDERIREATRARDEAEEAEARARAEGLVEAYQEVREEMAGGRLELEEAEGSAG